MLLRRHRSAAKRFGAFLARTQGAKVGITENPRRMAVIETDLDCVIADLRGCLRAQFRLVHRQKRRSWKFLRRMRFFLFPFVVASRTGTVVSEKGEVKMAGVAVGPPNVDTRSRFHVDFYVFWFL